METSNGDRDYAQEYAGQFGEVFANLADPESQQMFLWGLSVVDDAEEFDRLLPDADNSAVLLRLLQNEALGAGLVAELETLEQEDPWFRSAAEATDFRTQRFGAIVGSFPSLELAMILDSDQKSQWLHLLARQAACQLGFAFGNVILAQDILRDFQARLEYLKEKYDNPDLCYYN